MQIQISWLLQKPTDLDLHCLQRQDISGFSRTRVKRCLFSFVCVCKNIVNILICKMTIYLELSFEKQMNLIFKLSNMKLTIHTPWYELNSLYSKLKAGSWSGIRHCCLIYIIRTTPCERAIGGGGGVSVVQTGAKVKVSFHICTV